MPGQNMNALAWAAGRILYTSRLAPPTFYYCSPRREDLFPLRYIVVTNCRWDFDLSTMSDNSSLQISNMNAGMNEQ